MVSEDLRPPVVELLEKAFIQAREDAGHGADDQHAAVRSWGRGFQGASSSELMEGDGRRPSKYPL